MSDEQQTVSTAWPFNKTPEPSIAARLRDLADNPPADRRPYPIRELRQAADEIDRLRKIESAAKQWAEAYQTDNRPNRHEAEDWMMRLLS